MKRRRILTCMKNLRSMSDLDRDSEETWGLYFIYAGVSEWKTILT